MSSYFVLLDETYEPLIKKALRPLYCVDNAIEQLKVELKQHKGRTKPIFESNGWHYAVICRDNLYFVIIMQMNSRISPLSVLHYLNEVYQLCRGFVGKRLDKILVRDNFHLISELIDESSDYGVVQVSNYNIIHDFIKVEVIKGDEQTEIPTNARDKVQLEDQDETFKNSHILRTMTSAVSWRPKGINYAKNEFFLDVVEKMEFVMDLDEEVVRTNVVNGAITCRSFLSGMPQLSIGLNKVMQKNVHFMKRLKFHQCVDLDKLIKDDQPVVKFIPPDGEFELCNYKLSRPLHDEPIIKLQSFDISKKLRKNPDNQDKVLLKATITTHFKAQDSAKDLAIKIPINPIIRKWNIDLENCPMFKCDVGDVFFNLTDGSILWKIHHLKGGHGEKQYDLNCMFDLWDQKIHEAEEEKLRNSMDPPPLRTGPKLEKIWKEYHGVNPDESTEISDGDNDGMIGDSSTLVRMSFEVPYYAVSGLKVEYLKIEEPQLNYQSFPWVRYKTLNDNDYAYQVSI
ncbi:unnamed protein product [Kluyveromyces dobzhanskii CBS 2104]|uniref:WGS project CCBQ000000000 data, contig 00058 n=1 Tax=Kluyveromyces dobzhanskii CBS 2104 TaxID=1427455 RepID=A0A0A8LDU1_9SACH|nr:unnamed protein product [Kluyveromyces dobzhanskii CBS 2104]